MEPPRRNPQATSTPFRPDRPSIHLCERSSPVKNRKLEIGTSGSVRGGDGNIPTYSAPHHRALQTHQGRRAGVRKPPGKETAGEWAALSAVAAMGILLAATVQLGSGREAPVPIVGARQRRVGALRGSIEQMVG